MFNGKRLGLSVMVIALALFTTGIVGNAAADNLLVNADFETGNLTGWAISGQSSVSDVNIETGFNGPSAPGTHNAFMVNQAEAMGLTLKQATENGTATAGTVQYSYDIKLDQADVGGVLFVEIFAEQEGVGIIGGSGLMGPYWAWDWTTVAGEFEAPAGTTFLTIQFMANTGAAIGTNCIAHVDNVVLDQGTVPVEQTTLDQLKALYR
ncbi:MAG: hypothetical protein GY780_08995 [bacterium]|nr:hypothetical protein [bacterium]